MHENSERDRNRQCVCLKHPSINVRQPTLHYLPVGMYALFNVTQCNNKTFRAPVATGGITRTYYIAAEEAIWDYGPSGMNNFKGGSLTASGR